MTTPAFRRTRGILGTLLVATAFGWAGAGGCASAPREPTISRASYEGPAVRVDPLDGRHLVVFRAPSGGWRVEFDSVRERLEAEQVFITARRPDPRFVYTMSLVDHRVLTPAPADRPLEVFVRVLDHRERDGRYTEAADARAQQASRTPGSGEMARAPDR